MAYTTYDCTYADDEPEGYNQNREYPHPQQGEEDHDLRSQCSFQHDTPHNNNNNNHINNHQQNNKNNNSYNDCNTNNKIDPEQYYQYSSSDDEDDCKNNNNYNNNNNNFNKNPPQKNNCNQPNKNDYYPSNNKENNNPYKVHYDVNKFQQYIKHNNNNNFNNNNKNIYNNNNNIYKNEYKNNNNNFEHSHKNNNRYPRKKNSMRHRNINGFNCPQYAPQPTAIMTVRLPEEHISWTRIQQVDLLILIKKLSPNQNQIPYNKLHQHLAYEFPDEHHQVAHKLNNMIFTEENEGYICRKGGIGTKECSIKIIQDRKLIPKEIGKVLRIPNGKYKAMTYDSREVDAECDTIDEAKNKLLQQTNFDPNLNWHSKFYKAIRNFKHTKQIFRSLEAEVDCSEFSYLNDLYLLPNKVIEHFNFGVTFGDFLDFVQWNNPLLYSLDKLIDGDGINIMHGKIQHALSRAELMHSQRGYGILKCKYPVPMLFSSNKKEIEIVGGVGNMCCGCLIQYDMNNGKALNIKYIDGALPGFGNYVDIIAMNDCDSGSSYGGMNRHMGVGYNCLKTLNVDTLVEIIQEELKFNDPFDMHKFPRMVERKLNIEWDPRKFAFESLRAIFKAPKVKRICKLDNASSTALVSSHEKSKYVPDMDFIKKGFEKVLIKYGDPVRGYRMKKKGSKKTDIRAHFAELTGKALKPKPWFGINVKDLILRCDDVIRVDCDTEADGVWLLFLKKQY